MMDVEFEPVIGLEVHCQLATDSKLFCKCKARLSDQESVAEEQVNKNTCPVCAGHPGTLPVLNRKAVDYAIRVGLATQCKIRNVSVFARKNYFYPDLPKGYQISQYELPLCEDGFLDIELENNSTKRIGIGRIHMEEDAGKNVHMEQFSVVNLNRACVPLIEIVSRPDISNPEEAGAYLRALYSIVTYLEVCDGNLQEGNFRCDANVSVRPKGSTTFGTRAEIKNVNSFRFVEKAIEFEIHRQIELIRSGGKVIQETRLYDSAKNMTFSMRSKEEAHDYRYFPDPDLISLQVAEARIQSIQKSLPELPQQKAKRYSEEFNLSKYDATVLTASKAVAVFFEDVIAKLRSAGKSSAAEIKVAANLITGEVSRLMNEQGTPISKSKLTPQHICDLVLLLQESAISNTSAKLVIAQAWTEGGQAKDIVEAKGLKQVSDLSHLEPIVERILKANPAQVEQFKAGKEKIIGFFVGQVMKESGGKANPALLQDLIKKKINSS